MPAAPDAGVSRWPRDEEESFRVGAGAEGGVDGGRLRAAAGAGSNEDGRLRAATTFPQVRDGVRLVVVDPAVGRITATRMQALPGVLRAGDLLVVNDAATLPASLRGRDEDGREVELRLLQRQRDGSFWAVLFGAGDWRVRTEHRPAPPRLTVGARIQFDQRPHFDQRPQKENERTRAELAAVVVERAGMSERLYRVRFDREGDGLWAALYRLGKVVQYAHLAHELPLWSVQNVFAGRPWAFEMPSAGRALSWRILLQLRRRGVEVARLTHAAGLSATGDADLDARLPLPETYDIPAATVAAVEATRRRGGRVVAVGTTVVRALEGNHASAGQLRAGEGLTDLRIGPEHRLKVVDGLLSGLHEPEESHFALLRAFADDGLLRAAHRFARQRGFLSHELGDAMLILPRARSAAD